MRRRIHACGKARELFPYPVSRDLRRRINTCHMSRRIHTCRHLNGCDHTASLEIDKSETLLWRAGRGAAECKQCQKES
jgi:hypothetical protein